jgi:hypothetical protein
MAQRLPKLEADLSIAFAMSRYWTHKNTSVSFISWIENQLVDVLLMDPTLFFFFEILDR